MIYGVLGFFGFNSMIFCALEIYSHLKMFEVKVNSKFFVVALWIIGTHAVMVISLKTYFLSGQL